MTSLKYLAIGLVLCLSGQATGQPIPICSGQTQTGAIDYPSEMDTYYFFGDEGDRVLIRLVRLSGTLRGHIRLYPPGGGNYTTHAYNLVGNYTTIDVQLNQTGLYTIVVGDYYADGEGQYHITLLNLHDNLVSRDDPDGGQMSAGRTLSGTIDRASDMDAFQFSARQGDRVLVNLTRTSGDLRTHLRLYPPGGGNYVTYGYNLVGAYASIDVQLGKSGVYTAVVSDYYGDGEGQYRMTLLNLQDSLTSLDDPDGGPLAAGRTLQGTIDLASDMDAFQFSAREGDRVLMNLTRASGAMRCHVRLYPPGGGNYITYAYDLVGADAGIDTRLSQSGLYTAVISDYYGTQTGAYLLTLTEVGDITGSDLVVSSLALESHRTSPSSPVDVRWTVKNVGYSAAVPADHWLAFRLSDDPVYDACDLYVTATPIEATLEPQQEYSGSFELDVTQVAFGHYYLVAQVDANDVVRESSEANNTAGTALTVMMTEVYVDPAAAPGSSEDGSWEHPFDTIQEAVDAAMDGAEIILAPGLYTGQGNRDIRFHGKGVTVRSADPSDPEIVSETVIDCGGTDAEPHRAFAFVENEDAFAVIDGLTIEGGYAPIETFGNTQESVGGAVLCDNADPTIRRCVIRHCLAADYGGAVFSRRSSPAILDCEIRENVSYREGGGIHLEGSCGVRIERCAISYNLAGVLGGGVAMEFSCSAPSLIDCTVSRNTSNHRGGGLGCIRCPSVIVEGCLIEENEARYDGGAVYLEDSSLVLNDSTMRDNAVQQGGGSGLFSRANPAGSEVIVLGTTRIRGDVWDANDIAVNGPGVLEIDRDTVLQLSDSTIRCNTLGPGTILVDLNSQLTLGGEAHVDLRGTGPADETGQVECDGLLRLSERAVLSNARVRVSRTSFEDQSIVENCVITAEAGAPYGQFFIEEDSAVHLPLIAADGDRYLDVDPRRFDCNNIHIDDINVTITEGVGTALGGLFELRGRDLELAGTWDEFVCVVDGVFPEFDPNTWTIDRLELTAGAKLNLTNRFDFQAPYDRDGDYEVLYVNDLVLGPNSVLNTAFHRIYCAHDPVIAETASIINVPLLGFSLNNISFDDQTDYATRVKHNNFKHPTRPEYNRTHVERLKERIPGRAGVMRMCTVLDADRDSRTYGQVLSARAKALFAKSSEETLLIQFEYLWESDDGELVVWLSDAPELIDPGDPSRQEHYVEIARLTPPPAGFAGAAESGRLATFEAEVNRKHLDFVRGTRVEFELTGPDGTSILIDNWDPIVLYCSPDVCADVALLTDGTSNAMVDSLDFLAILAACGTCTSASSCCLDLAPFGGGDGYITVDDAQWVAGDWHNRLNLCPRDVPLAPAWYDAAPATFKMASIASVPGREGLTVNPRSPLLISAKTYRPGAFLSEGLFGRDASGQVRQLAGGSGTDDGRLYRRLIARPTTGSVYQLDEYDGLRKVTQDGGVVDEEPLAWSAGLELSGEAGQVVYLGVQDDRTGRPLCDAAFDNAGNLYVVPVVVADPQSYEVYTAAARLRLDGTDEAASECRILHCQGSDDWSNLCEIEIGALGDVYVLNRKGRESADGIQSFDWLLRFSSAGDLIAAVRLEDVGVTGPVALCASATTARLYLASCLNEPAAARTYIHRFDTSDPTTLVREATIRIDGMGHVTGMTEDAAGNVHVVGFAMSDIPTLVLDPKTQVCAPDGDPRSNAPFYRPCIATVTGTSTEVTATSLNSGYRDEADEAEQMALPLSIVYVGSPG